MAVARFQHYVDFRERCMPSVIYQHDITHLSHEGLSDVQAAAIAKQLYSRHIRHTAHLHSRPRTLSFYAELYNTGWSIVDIAARSDVAFSPALLSRMLLECPEVAGGGVPRARVGEAMRDPPAHIADVRLRAEVERAIASDKYCGPRFDAQQNESGRAAESRLTHGLVARCIPFQTEADMKRDGYAKTPDVLLPVPIGVIGPVDGRPHIVAWIDSKAMFGDPDAQEDAREQLLGYVGRYGPGLVIYWAGHVDYLTEPTGDGAERATSIHPDIVLASDLPTEFVWPGARNVSVFKSQYGTESEVDNTYENISYASDEIFGRTRASTTPKNRRLSVQVKVGH